MIEVDYFSYFASDWEYTYLEDKAESMKTLIRNKMKQPLEPEELAMKTNSKDDIFDQFSILEETAACLFKSIFIQQPSTLLKSCWDSFFTAKSYFPTIF